MVRARIPDSGGIPTDLWLEQSGETVILRARRGGGYPYEVMEIRSDKVLLSSGVSDLDLPLKDGRLLVSDF